MDLPDRSRRMKSPRSFRIHSTPTAPMDLQLQLPGNPWCSRSRRSYSYRIRNDHIDLRRREDKEAGFTSGTVHRTIELGIGIHHQMGREETITNGTSEIWRLDLLEANASSLQPSPAGLLISKGPPKSSLCKFASFLPTQPEQREGTWEEETRGLSVSLVQSQPYQAPPIAASLITSD